MRSPLSATSTSDLTDEFERLCIAQARSLDREEIAAFNRRFDIIVEIENELQRRDGDQRRALQMFYRHPNLQVALTAARANLAIDYAAARATIEAIAASKHNPQAGDAGMSLWALDEGIFKPS